MFQHTESLIGMETELNMETALKKSKAECIELRRLIIIPRGGFPAPSLVLLLGFSGVVTRKGTGDVWVEVKSVGLCSWPCL